jgi:adenosylmethionine-8-amino-7-oxononanoate aminotransferase
MAECRHRGEIVGDVENRGTVVAIEVAEEVEAAGACPTLI